MGGANLIQTVDSLGEALDLLREQDRAAQAYPLWFVAARIEEKDGKYEVMARWSK